MGDGKTASSMAPDQWQKVKSVLAQVLEAPTAERDDLLHSACAGDDSLRFEVESMLGFDDAHLAPLDSSAYESYVAKKSGLLPGERVERYEIIEELAAGGMGSVYLAKRIDGAFDQKVALKIIKSGFNSHSIVQRFYVERQILASLKHPNIAQLIDGGTTDDGFPFFVMEYVAGSVITQYADDGDLDLEKRLNLFCKVCSAVSFAHQSLIIHRDLKPSNILVTSGGEPKLLDFGIAKLLSSETESFETQTQNVAFTPDYASPEQVMGEKLTTASDIYSLGVILYELLTGRRPYEIESNNFGKIIKAVCETDVTAPSRVGRMTTSRRRDLAALPIHPIPVTKLKGDLDNIVLKSLRKEPERRYGSVEQFADDIRRFLNNLPVTASSDTWSYRTSKFIGRNRIAVAAAAIIFLTLIAGIATTYYQARAARFERARAESRFNDVRRLANSFVFEINDKIEESPIKARELLVQRAVEYLDSLNRESSDDTALQAELAAAYEKVGDVQRELFTPNLGDAGRALESHQKALALRRNLRAREPQNLQYGLDLASSYGKVGDLYYVTGKLPEALANYKEAIDINLDIEKRDPSNVDVKQRLGKTYMRLGQVILRSGSLTECLRNYETAFEINRRLILTSPYSTTIVRNQSILFIYIGWVRVLMGDNERAVRDFRNALTIDEYFLESDPNNTRVQEYLAGSCYWLAIGLREAGDAVQALPLMQRTISIQQKLYDADRRNFSELNSLADSNYELANIMRALEKRDESVALLRKSIRQYEEVAANDPSDMNTRYQITMVKRLLADALARSGKGTEAFAVLKAIIPEFEALNQKDADNIEWKFELAVAYSRFGKILQSQHKPDDASVHLDKAEEILESLQKTAPENINYAKELNELRTQPTRTG